MRRDTDLVTRRRPWLRWCATILALAFVLVAVHQVVSHHPNHARCQVCTSLDRPSLAAADVGIALPRPAPFRLPPTPADCPLHSCFYAFEAYRGPPPRLVV
jgi:hypothetical protein